MTFLRTAFQELAGLFIDDGRLALYTVLLIAIVTALIKLVGLAPLAGGGILAVGTVAILVESVVRQARAGH